MGTWLGIAMVDGIANVIKAPPGSGGGQRAKRVGGGVGIGILAERVSMVIKPPPGVGGGNELSGRSCPGACVGARSDGREWGEGWGMGCFVCLCCRT